MAYFHDYGLYNPKRMHKVHGESTWKNTRISETRRVQRGLIGEIITRLEKRGLRMIGAKFMWVSRELAETHYAIHKGKSLL
jgi:hypothetical protein